MPTRRTETSDPGERMRFLYRGPATLTRAAGYMLSAEGFFRAAMELAPGDPAPYLALVKSVYGLTATCTRPERAAIDEAAKFSNNDPYDLRSQPWPKRHRGARRGMHRKTR